MSTDNRTLLNDCEDETVAFTTSGAQQGDQASAGLFYEGTQSVEVQHSNNNDRTSTTQTSAAATFNLDLSDSTLYLMVKDNLTDTFAASTGGNGGSQFVIGDGTDLIGYPVGGSDAVGLPVTPYFATYKLDVSEVVASPPGNVAVYSGSEANLDQTAITEMGYGSLHLSKAAGAIPNVFIDGFYYIANGSYALTINGGTVGTPETMADVVGDDITNGWGLVGNPLGSQYQFMGPTQWGDTGTADSYFTASDEQWYFLGDNGGGHAVGATHFLQRLIGNSTGTNSFVATRVTFVNTATRAEFDLSNADMDLVKFDACSFTNFGTITFPTVVANDKFCNNTVFNNCDRMDLQSLDMDGNTWNGTTDANGAIAFDATNGDPSNQDNSTFVSDGTGHAIEVAPVGAGPFTYNLDGYTFDGYASQAGTDTNRVFFINPATLSADITINLVGSAAINSIGGGTDFFSHRDVASYTGTLLIQSTVTLEVNVSDSNGDPISGARVRIENASTGAEISQGSTNGSGVYSDGAYNFSGDLGVLTKVRLKGFRNFRTAGTIASTGLSVGVTMQTDSIVDLP